VNAALLKFSKQLHRCQFLIRLPKPRNALLALALIQMLCESIDVGVSKFFTRFQVWGAIQNGKHFLWQFVAWVFATHIVYPFTKLYTEEVSVN